jgi:hypothetical protein
MSERPCGGIHPIKGTSKGLRKPAAERVCFVCHKDNAQHFYYEGDAYVHAQCAIKFLQTEDAKVIIDHGHTVQLNFKVD